MTDTATPTADTETKADNKAATALAQVIWATSLGKEVPTEPAARKAAWADAKRDQVRFAKAVIKRLNNRGLSLVATGTDTDTEE